MATASVLEGVDAGLAVDLGSPRQINRAKKRRGRKRSLSVTVKQRVDTEVDRLTTRLHWLERKASRLRIGNGKRKATAEAVLLRQLVLTLSRPPKDRPEGHSYQGSGSRHSERAAALLNEIVPER